MSEYTTTTEDVRAYVTQLRGTGSSLARAQSEAVGGWFDRWLAAHDAEVRNDALEEAADELVTRNCFTERTLDILDTLRKTINTEREVVE